MLTGPIAVALNGDINLKANWRQASRESAKLAPNPDTYSPAVVQVYAARAFAWRGAFAVHTWIAVKEQAATHYTIHEVFGWNRRWGGEVVVSHVNTPDRFWYGQKPELLTDLRGGEAEIAIKEIQALVADYPYKKSYSLWPGPNSNTFIAYLIRNSSVLNADLPTTAIGKDYLPEGGVLAAAPSGTGWQVSLFGIFGLIAAPVEGIEINLLSLSFGMDVSPFALRLPGVGRLEFSGS